jgi:hypothetical protein
MSSADLLKYLKASTAKSGVLLKVKNKDVLARVASLL